MAGTLRNLLVRVGADITGLRQGLKNAQKDVKYFGRNVTGSLKEIKGAIGGAAAALGGGFILKSGIQDAMRYEALMATLGESMGASRKDFEKWQGTVGQSMGYSRLQAAETANILSLNFKKIATSQEDLVNKTTKMMEVAAVIANKRGMTMQEVSDRIRSAMNQEADGADELGVNVRIAAVKTSQAYQEMANGAPWDSLSEGMRKTILYHHILQQVSENLGTTMQDTTAMRMAAFTAALADVKMALGQAFLPIVYSVLPLLTKMAQALYRVLQIVAAFMRALFGGGFKYKPPVTGGDVKTTNEQAKALDGVGKAADKAGKKSAKAAKKSKDAWSGTFGFDEVHTIKDPAAAAGAGGGAGAGGAGGGGGGLGDLGGGMEMPSLDNSSFMEGLDAMTEKFRKWTEPIREMAKKVWEAVSGFAIEKFQQISAWWQENGAQITQAFKNVWEIFKPIIMGVISFVWESVKGLVDGVITFFQGIIEFFTGVFTGDWQMAWEGLKKIFFGAVQAIWNFFNLSFIGGLKKGIVEFVLAAVKNVKGFADDFIKFFKNIWENVWNILKGMGKNIKGIITDIKEWWTDFFFKIALKWVEFSTNVKTAAKTAWDNIVGVFKGAVEWFARNVITPIVNKFHEIKDAFKESITEGFKTVINIAIRAINKMIGGLNAVKNKIPGANLLPDVPKIPELARGGITTGPTLAMVGDNVGGREVIAPLDRLEGMLTNSVIQAMQLGNTGGGPRHSGDIVLNIDGRTFARIVKPFMDKEQNRVGTDVRIRTI
jgi:hypothetical protein